MSLVTWASPPLPRALVSRGSGKGWRSGHRGLERRIGSDMKHSAGPRETSAPMQAVWPKVALRLNSPGKPKKGKNHPPTRRKACSSSCLAGTPYVAEVGEPHDFEARRARPNIPNGIPIPNKGPLQAATATPAVIQWWSARSKADGMANTSLLRLQKRSARCDVGKAHAGTLVAPYQGGRKGYYPFPLLVRWPFGPVCSWASLALPFLGPRARCRDTRLGRPSRAGPLRPARRSGSARHFALTKERRILIPYAVSIRIMHEATVN